MLHVMPFMGPDLEKNSILFYIGHDKTNFVRPKKKKKKNTAIQSIFGNHNILLLGDDPCKHG